LRLQPADFELAADGNEHVGFLELEDEARLGFDEMRILVTPREGFDGNPIAADLTRNRCEIFGRRDDIQLRLRKRRHSHNHDGDSKYEFFHNSSTNYQ
jgi:hypothetical protein